jgi:large subunit ribosomal protein L29
MANSKKKNLKDLSYAELIAERGKVKQEYMDIRIQSVVGSVDNPMQKRTLRRQIAKLNTFIRQKEIAELNK